MAVRRVLAEANVGEEHHFRRALREGAQRLLDDAVLVVGARGRIVLLLRDTEEEDGADAEPQELLGLVGEAVDRTLRDSGQAFERLLDAGARTGEERVDEVAQVEPRLADELPEGAGAPEASEAGGRKGAHASNLRIPSRAAAPKATASPMSQAASRARVDQGSLS